MGSSLLHAFVATTGRLLWLFEEIEIQTEHLGKTLIDILKNEDKYNYELKMNLILRTTETEDKSFNIDLIKSGKMELRK